MAPPSHSGSKDLNSQSEQALLIALYHSKREKPVQESSLEELALLADTAGVTVVASHLLELRSIEPATYIGEGKIESLAQEIIASSIDVIIFDENLSPTQYRNLEKLLNVKVMDRTGLILDIFAHRARSREGKLQVELAQLEYILPRLSGKGTELSQLGGGIGTRGPGETKLELDRRKARARVSFLKEQIKKVQTHRELHRQRREEITMPLVALVGYTNAGKSTLLNYLTQSSVLAEDKLFATLDPTARRLKLPSGREVLLVDTVGFVNKLPHQLIDSFKSTFEETASAHLLIHMIDVSHPHWIHQKKVVEDLLLDLNLHKKPTILVANKIDRLSPSDLLALKKEEELKFISAQTGEGVQEFLLLIDQELARNFRWMSLLLPHTAGSDLSILYRSGRVLKREDRPQGIYLEVEVDQKGYNQFKNYQL